MSAPPHLPLEGVRVLDLTTFLSGPLVTRSLADLGAEIIKIEPPAGDPTRGGTGMRAGQPPSPFWLALHRDRRSVVLDLKVPAAQAVLLELVAASDVLVENFRPGVMGRLGLPPERLREANPRLVEVSITGFGPDGPVADQVSIDGPIQAFAGLVDLAGSLGLARHPAPLTVADIAGASAATQAVLAALFARERGGTGCYIEVSLFEALLQWLSLADRSGSLAPPVTLVVEGSDGAAFLVQTPLHFRDRLLELVGTVAGFAAFAADPRFATVEGIRLYAEDYSAGMRRAFASKPRAEWLAALQASGIPAAAVQSIDDALRHPQLVHRGAIAEVAVDGVADARVLLGAVRFDGVRRSETARPPVLGEHNAEVLGGVLGYDDARLAALADAGAFGPGAQTTP